MIFLDTNIVVAIVNARRPGARARLAAAMDERVPVVLPLLVYHELKFGIEKSVKRALNESNLQSLLATGINVEPLDAGDMVKAATIRNHLRQRGTPIGPYDLLIAAQACRAGASLVTNNTSEFSRIPELVLEDWTNE